MTTAHITQPPRRSRLEIAGRAVGGLVVVGLGAMQALLWLLVAGFACDESCDDRSSSWHDNPDAWQWSAIGWLGIATFVCSIAFAISLGTRHTRASVALFAATLVLGIAPAILSGAF
jgi:hypothetical protein